LRPAVRNPNPAELEPARRLNAELAQSLWNPAPDQVPTLEQLSRFGERNAAFDDALVAMANSPMLCWCIQRVQSVAFASPAAVVIPAEGDGGG
jgi:DNA-binding GntR family transcriptional regulator